MENWWEMGEGPQQPFKPPEDSICSVGTVQDCRARILGVRISYLQACVYWAGEALGGGIVPQPLGMTRSGLGAPI